MKPTLILALLVALTCTGCGAEAATQSVTDSATSIPTVNDVLADATQQEPVVVAPEVSAEDTATVAEESDAPAGFGSYDSVDIDLTTMNSVMVYSQVYDMVVNPAEYEGKTVKMHGIFAYYYVDSVDTYYFGIVVEDATACCAQGIEFVLTDEAERTVPNDYPEIMDEATVVGVFTAFNPVESPDYEYYHLEQAEFITE